jgi:CDP-diglyceride synthetase
MIINRRKILPVIEIIVGTILLIREIYQMTYLPSVQDNLYGGLVDFVKYKENTYSLIFMWSILLITGIFSWINDKLKWISHQILIITISMIILVSMLVMIIQNQAALSAIFGLLLIGLIILEIRLCRSDLIEKLKLNNINKRTSMILGLFSALIYWIIELKLG